MRRIYFLLVSATLVIGLTPGGIKNAGAYPFHPWASEPTDGPFSEIQVIPLSLAFRNVNPTGASATAALSIAEEKRLSAYPAHYRIIPDILKDDQGDGADSPTFALRAGRAATACGNSQTSIALRIADCVAMNPATATWDGRLNGAGPQSIWKLVTKTANGAGSGYEVWADMRTGLLWSDLLGTTNWCRAAGNAQANDPGGICNNGANQNQVTPESWCAEGTDSAGRSLNTPATYDPMKGGMRRASTAISPSVVWRLPTLADVQQGFLDGLDSILPASAGNSNYIHTSTVWSVNAGRTNAFWYYKSSSWFYTSYFTRASAIGVHCVGMSDWNPAAVP